MARYTKLPVMLGISLSRASAAAGAAPALTGEEQPELERLRKDEERYQRQRIAVSQEFISTVDRFQNQNSAAFYRVPAKNTP